MNLHTLCYDLLLLYEFCHIFQNILVSLIPAKSNYISLWLDRHIRERKSKFVTSGSASLTGSPTTKTKFFCTTLTLLSCRRLSNVLLRRCCSRTRFSVFIAATWSDNTQTNVQSPNQPDHIVWNTHKYYQNICTFRINMLYLHVGHFLYIETIMNNWMFPNIQLQTKSQHYNNL